MVSRSSLPHDSGDAQSERLSIEEKARRYDVIRHVLGHHNEWTGSPSMSGEAKLSLLLAYELSGTYPRGWSDQGQGTEARPVDMDFLAVLLGMRRRWLKGIMQPFCDAGILRREEGRDPVTGGMVVKLAAGRWLGSDEVISVPARSADKYAPTEEVSNTPSSDSDSSDSSDTSDPGDQQSRVQSLSPVSPMSPICPNPNLSNTKVAERTQSSPHSRGKRARRKHGRR